MKKTEKTTKERFKACVSSYLILEKDNKVLLHLRQNTGYADGCYSLVAGHIDGNEPASLAMAREAKEEAGIIINPQDLQVMHIMHRISDRENIDIFFHCKKWEGEIKNMEPHKCGELLFADKDNLPKNTLEYVKKAISNTNSKIFYSELGW
ncbi:NUDIX domain-containing protein [Candidatus Dependentiae bacterium]